MNAMSLPGYDTYKLASPEDDAAAIADRAREAKIEALLVNAEWIYAALGDEVFRDDLSVAVSELGSHGKFNAQRIGKRVLDFLEARAVRESSP